MYQDIATSKQEHSVLTFVDLFRLCVSERTTPNISKFTKFKLITREPDINNHKINSYPTRTNFCLALA